MRLPTIVIAIFFCATSAAWSAGPDAMRVATKPDTMEKEVIRFDNTTLVLAFQQQKNGDTIKEYIPQGETLERWTKLAALYEYPDLNDPQAVVDALVKRLAERNADIPYDVRTDSKTGAIIVDFIIWPEEAASADVAEYVEYNIFKYQAKPGGGLTAQQYAIRKYKDIPGFLAKLRPEKDRLLKAMTSDGLEMPSGKSSLVE
jgi:hypothetical protein